MVDDPERSVDADGESAGGRYLYLALGNVPRCEASQGRQSRAAASGTLEKAKSAAASSQDAKWEIILKRKKQTFRVGQKAQLLYDGKHVIEIDASLVPDRLYHEKGTDRWWAKRQLRPVGPPQKAAKPVSPKTLAAAKKMHSLAFRGTPGKALEAASPKIGLSLRECLECHGKFKPRRRWQKFCTTKKPPCQRVYNKRLAVVAAVGAAEDF